MSTISKTKNFVRITLAAALTAAAGAAGMSCTDSPGDTIAIAFTVKDMEDIVARSTGDLVTDYLTDMSVWAHYTGTKAFAGLTSGDMGWTPNFMYGQNVTKAAEGWKYTPLKYWPEDTDGKLSFFALTPIPSTSNGITAPAADYAGGYPRISVTPPLAAWEQEDFCVASAVDRTIDDGAVSFTFAHALTKVTFAVKYSGGTLSAGRTLFISQIALRNVGSQGTLTFAEQPTGFTWNIGSGTADYSIDRSNGGLIVDPLATSMQNYSSVAGTLLLLPQTLPANAVVTVAATLMENGYPVTISVMEVETGGMTWPAGKGVNYNLDIDISALTITNYQVEITDWQQATINEGFEIH